MKQYNDILNRAKSHSYLDHQLDQWKPYPSHTKMDYASQNHLLFLSIQSTHELCRFLNISARKLERLINEPSYQQYTIQKRSGGRRIIQAPSKELKQVQKKLNAALQTSYSMLRPMTTFGFCKNEEEDFRSNIVKNAEPHIGMNYLLGLDLQDFFPGIPARKVKELFLGPLFQMPREIAILLTLLMTYEGKLPVGAPTSPVLSNFICLDLDENLAYFSTENQLNYTRYADDLSFSSDNYFDRNTIDAIKKAIQDQGFTINEKKFRIQTKNKKQVVTGLIVNEKVNVDRKYLKLVRAKIHSIQTLGLEAAANIHLKFPANLSNEDIAHFQQQLQGQVNFIGQVRGAEDEVYLKMRRGVGGGGESKKISGSKLDFA